MYRRGRSSTGGHLVTFWDQEKRRSGENQNQFDAIGSGPAITWCRGSTQLISIGTPHVTPHPHIERSRLHGKHIQVRILK